MLQTPEARVEQNADPALIDMCTNLVKAWFCDLDPEEKEVWLWNASVQLVKIKQRRKA